MKVGIDRTPYWAATALVVVDVDLDDPQVVALGASSSRIGLMTRQGPHQAAQKSTMTGRSDSSTSAWKESSVTVRGGGGHGAKAGRSARGSKSDR